MRVEAGISAMRTRAVALEEARARLAGNLRSIRDLAGYDGVRTILKAEMARLERPGGRDWIG